MWKNAASLLRRHNLHLNGCTLLPPTATAAIDRRFWREEKQKADKNEWIKGNTLICCFLRTSSLFCSFPAALMTIKGRNCRFGADSRRDTCRLRLSSADLMSRKRVSLFRPVSE